MARGPKKHLKRLNAPKSWLLSKMGGIWAPRPSTGPHKLRESLPLTIALRNRLKYALTRREVIMIVNRRLVQVDQKVRTDMNYPAGLMDVVSIAQTDEQFRVLYDTKGRFVLHKLDPEEAKFKLLRVLKISKGSKHSIGRNPFHGGQAGVVPYAVTHDGRTVRYPDPLIKPGDTMRFDLKTNKVLDFVKADIGNLALITKGANIGRVGIIQSKEKHQGSFDIVHLKDRNERPFATRSSNVFVIGTAAPLITLPKTKGVKMTILEERSERAKAKAEKGKKRKKKSDKKQGKH